MDKKQKPKFDLKALGRVVKLLVKTFPVQLTVVVICIIVSALVGVVPAVFTERLATIILDGLKTGWEDALAALIRLLIPVMLRQSQISPHKKCNAVTREERARLAARIKSMAVVVEGFRPLSEAIVTAGGVSVKEINAKTMESKLVSGLFFAGEVLDVDAYTGGFNLQIAFSTGYAAGNAD